MCHYILGESSSLFIHEKHLGTAIIIYYVSLFPRSAPSSPDVSPQSSPRPPRANNDRLTLLTRLVRKGEKKGLFVEKMPASIYQVKLASSCLTGSNLEVQRYKVCVYTTSTFFLSGNGGSTRFIWPLCFVFCVDGERWESQIHEEQRRLQQRLLQLHPLACLRQCSMCFYISQFSGSKYSCLHLHNSYLSTSLLRSAFILSRCNQNHSLLQIIKLFQTQKN